MASCAVMPPARNEVLASAVSAWEVAIKRASGKLEAPPDLAEAAAAAEIRNTCRQKGIQVGTIDALLARLCPRHDLLMLSTDRDSRLRSGGRRVAS